MARGKGRLRARARITLLTKDLTAMTQFATTLDGEQNESNQTTNILASFGFSFLVYQTESQFESEIIGAFLGQFLIRPQL